MEAKFAPEKLIRVWRGEPAIVSKDLRVISPCFDKLFPDRGVYSPSKECKFVPLRRYDIGRITLSWPNLRQRCILVSYITRQEIA